MKAYVIHPPYGIDSVELKEKSIQEPLENQVLVQLKAVALNYRDRLVINGVGGWRPQVPRVPGSDGMGVVVKTGLGVKNISAGDRVIIVFFPNWMGGKISSEKLANPLGGAARDGTLQEFITVDENELVVVPDYLTNEEAATLPCAGLTAWNGMFVSGHVKKDDYVLIEGTGGVSLFSLQLALLVEAIPIVTSGSDEKLEKVKSMGAVHLINYTTTPNWEPEVLRLTRGKGVDHVMEVVGGKNIGRSLSVAASEATISVIGLIEGMSSQIELNVLMSKQIKLQGVEVGSKEMLVDLINFFDQYKLRPVIDSVYKFNAFKAAFICLERSRHFGKIGISFN